ncbi:MAG: glutamine--fructose-6-phosphate transaminase (isomerizing) [Bacteroidales bacterium]|nr:glutamine--fructose-6-phosphate transaminase (isomerizing) [Bacteroidales bacterium]
MCGIIGYTGSRQVRDILIDGLLKLEYRGYDSAGIAIHNGRMRVIKSPGKVSKLVELLPRNLRSNTGIAHTRWATHGEPSEINAHPHTSGSGKLVMVHNGIIENAAEIETYLRDKGYSSISETDTEILLNLIDHEYELCEGDLLKALIKTFEKVEGSYALAIIERDRPGRITMCRKDSPLIMGIDDTGFFVASDIYAVSDYTGRFVFPDNNDIIIADRDEGARAYDGKGKEKALKISNFTVRKENPDRGSYNHFMQKEIFEQPHIISELAASLLSVNGRSASGHSLVEVLPRVRRITILGCGTSWHAGLIGRYLIEKHVRIPVNVEYASEFRYRDPVIEPDDLVISISQSGETADTIAANKLALQGGAITLGLLNVRNSSLDRDTHFQIYLEAGDEIGVASTKAYTAQIVQLSRLTALLSGVRGNGSTSGEMSRALADIAGSMQLVLDNSEAISQLASRYAFSDNFLFLGRGLNFPTALEGALKLKEISYIHAEGYPGAEMKHGPIALIDFKFPTLVVLTDRESRSKMLSNIKEIKARKGRVIAIINEDDEAAEQLVDDVIRVPSVPDIVSPLISVVPLQLFAYYVALLRGCNVDQPRNLAKSVTVE